MTEGKLDSKRQSFGLPQIACWRWSFSFAETPSTTQVTRRLYQSLCNQWHGPMASEYRATSRTHKKVRCRRRREGQGSGEVLPIPLSRARNYYSCKPRTSRQEARMEVSGEERFRCVVENFLSSCTHDLYSSQASCKRFSNEDIPCYMPRGVQCIELVSQAKG